MAIREIGRASLETIDSPRISCWPSCRPRVDAADGVRWRPAGQIFSEAAFRAYRGLVYETPNFEVYFREATPLLEIADLKIGSRPASRTKSGRIEDLRAIPWSVLPGRRRGVMLPGLGSGFSGSAATKSAPEKLRPLYKNSASFRTTVANMEMVLAGNPPCPYIARRYAELVERPRSWPESVHRPHRR